MSYLVFSLLFFFLSLLLSSLPLSSSSFLPSLFYLCPSLLSSPFPLHCTAVYLSERALSCA